MRPYRPTLHELRASGLPFTVSPAAGIRTPGKRGQPEVEFQAEVLKYAKFRGWRTAHFRPAKTEKGWRTAVQGDGAGFPDTLLVRGEQLIVAELKAAKKKPSPEQIVWLEAFRGAGVPAYVWTPESWAEIERILA